MISKIIAITLLLFHLTYSTNIYCYYESSKIAKFPPEEIDPKICTHILYASVSIESDGNLKQLSADDQDQIARLNALKKRNPKVKIMPSIDGWSDGTTDTLSDIAGNATAKNTMAESLSKFIQTYAVDGFDINWYYPSQMPGREADRENFVDLLSILRQKLPTSHLTIAALFVPENASYNVPTLAEQVDAINLMTYDFHTFDEGKTGQNSPLFPSSGDDNYAKTYLSVNRAVKNWLDAGAPAEKLGIGLPFYGHGFQLADPKVNTVNSPTVGEGNFVRYTNYYEICVLNDTTWTRRWDSEQQVPYKFGGVNGTDWLGYDDVESIGLKVKFAKKQNLGALMIWALDYDDTLAVCGEKNPLLNAIKNNL